ncbi:unnamed protein product, partial [Staurois parvus]
MRGNQRVNCVLGVFYYGAVSVCFTVITLLWIAVLCTAIQSSVPELTGSRTVSKQNSSPPPEMQNH